MKMARTEVVDNLSRRQLANPTRSLIVCWGERTALLLLIAYFCVHSMPRAWKSLVTDFPNYYLAAQLAHQGFDASRMYEWQWFEREKDHRAIPIRVIGLVPITPFSTLFVWPLTALKPLAAKRVWITLSLALLFPISWAVRSMTGLSYQRIALLFALSFPLYRNIEFGQFYVVLLLLIATACWACMRERPALAGALLAIAAMAKIFPVLFFLFLLQRRSWRALASGAVVAAAASILSIGAFGWSVHRTYINEVLPWAVKGEIMPPYVTSASISGILHILFLQEPQWNPNPWHVSVLAFSVLQPLLQMLLFAPAVLLIRRQDMAPRRIMLEWSALLTATLAISTVPASYNFVLMVLPVSALSVILLERKQYAWLAALLVAYIGIGIPTPSPLNVTGLTILLYTPRLTLMIAVLIGHYALLWLEPAPRAILRDWSRTVWAAAMTIAVAFAAQSTFARELAMRQEYAYRLPLAQQGYLNATPQFDAGNVDYIEFTLDGYHLTSGTGRSAMRAAASDSSDDLSFSSCSGQLLVERAGNLQSQVIDLARPLRTLIDDAGDPMVSSDGQSLAFIRDEYGRGRLMERAAFQSVTASDTHLTPASMNVFEASFLSPANYVFAASVGGDGAQLYQTTGGHTNLPLALSESRYPALSPDGQWLAYSHLDHGVWNLWIRDENNGMTRRIGNVPCNEIQPSWEGDSKTLLYSTDCGRSLWFTAVARRKVIP